MFRKIGLPTLLKIESRRVAVLKIRFSYCGTGWIEKLREELGGVQKKFLEWGKRKCGVCFLFIIAGAKKSNRGNGT